MPAIERASIDLGEVLQDISVPDLSTAMADLSSAKAKEKEDLFAEKKRKGWDKSVEARCDFSPKPRLTRRAGLFFVSLWQKSLYGRTLTDIKSDDAMVDFFADNLAPFLNEVLGEKLHEGGWCIITTPRRRHKERNFATMTAELLAQKLGIPFYIDVCSCRNKQRMNAIFTVHVVPKEQNIICFDDFVTTGQTLQAMKRAFEPYHKNMFMAVGVNNKL